MPACSFRSASSPPSSPRPGTTAPTSGSRSACSRSRPRRAASEVVTERGRLAAARVVVTAGAWAPGLAGTAFGTRLRVLRQVLYWFGVDAPALYAPERCPVFIWLHGGGGQRASMYGFPMIDGVAGPKMASEQDTVESDPDRVDRQVAEDEARSVYETTCAAGCAA